MNNLRMISIATPAKISRCRYFLKISLTRIIIVKHNQIAHNAITHTGWTDTVAIACFVIVIN